MYDVSSHQTLIVRVGESVSRSAVKRKGNEGMVSTTRFARPVGDAAAAQGPNLYVANCGPAVGVSLADVATAFAAFGKVAAVHPADGSGARVVVCFADAGAAGAAAEAWGGGTPCSALGGRVLHIRHSVPRPAPPSPASDAAVVALDAAELAIPGVFLVKDFVTPDEEQELLAAVDAGPWKRLAKRRVQHYGYEFLYETRNVDSKQFLGELPSFVSSVLERITSFPSGGGDVERHKIDQLTVNEYPPGVGLSPHIDTHSAFDASIFSLSLLGSCVMEFRKYSQGTCQPAAATDIEGNTPAHCSDFIRKAIFLPQRSMLLMSGEGRYAWHHYIPHHKVDIVGEDSIRRSSRRISFTFRKIRSGPCFCEYSQFCDSQRGTFTGE